MLESNHVFVNVAYCKLTYILESGVIDPVHKKGYVDLVEMTTKDGASCCYGTTLVRDPTCTIASSWTTTDPSTFLIRGKTFLRDNQKVHKQRISMMIVRISLSFFNVT